MKKSNVIPFPKQKMELPDIKKIVAENKVEREKVVHQWEEDVKKILK